MGNRCEERQGRDLEGQESESKSTAAWDRVGNIWEVSKTPDGEGFLESMWVT